jgi:hypothetical protein
MRLQRVGIGGQRGLQNGNKCIYSTEAHFNFYIIICFYMDRARKWPFPEASSKFSAVRTFLYWIHKNKILKKDCSTWKLFNWFVT